MIEGLLRALFWRGASTLSRELNYLTQPILGKLRRIGMGLAVIVSSIVIGSLSLFFLLLSLFFYLGRADSLLGPALWTGAIGGILGIVLVIWGVSMVRRPY